MTLRRLNVHLLNTIEGDVVEVEHEHPAGRYVLAEEAMEARRTVYALVDENNRLRSLWLNREEAEASPDFGKPGGTRCELWRVLGELP